MMMNDELFLITLTAFKNNSVSSIFIFRRFYYLTAEGLEGSNNKIKIK